MEKPDAVKFMNVFAKARRKGAEVITSFNDSMDLVLIRLMHEGVANFMSPEQIAAEAGVTPKRVRTLMRKHRLDPSQGKRALANNAAQALQKNSELMGIKPWQMDLTSPLAYLPMGDRLRTELEEKRRHRVFPETCPTCGAEQ